jgi:protein arginine kinase activator
MNANDRRQKMLCDYCHKKTAVVRYTEVKDGVSVERRACRECAELNGLARDLNQALTSLSEALAGMIHDIVAEADQENVTNCPHCGTVLTDLKKLGRLGCPQCYQVFRANLNPLLKRIHGPSQHLGKRRSGGVPAAGTERDLLEGLRREMREAVSREDYERAALLRDEIRQLEIRAADEPAR